ncbi:MAG: putative peptidoglycan glycosyltransferase FtsW [Bacteroidota bacterium]|nr:putative peptidoglycan glycosyltransferase FtsW [Bacteroidota bacterium]
MKKASVGIFILSILLLAIGLIIVMSASSTFSETKFDSTFRMFGSHVAKVAIGIICLLACTFIDYRLYKKIIKVGFLATVVLLVITLFIASNVKGAGRWIHLGFFTFQPSDIAKYALIMYLAALIERKGDDIKDLKKGFLPCLVWILLVAGLVIIQPNVSNGALILGISLIVLFVGNAQWKHVAITGVIGIACIALVILVYPHARARISSFISPENNHQVQQAIIGLGSGGLQGVGVGHSRQNNLFLPESYGDFIFAICGEELGFIGSILIMSLFVLFFFLGLVIAKKAPDKFGQILAFGISFTILVYACVNMAVASGAFPTTGLPLPFISYGGTSTFVVCGATGILINIGIVNSAVLKARAAQPAGAMR